MQPFLVDSWPVVLLISVVVLIAVTWWGRRNTRTAIEPHPVSYGDPVTRSLESTGPVRAHRLNGYAMGGGGRAYAKIHPHIFWVVAGVAPSSSNRREQRWWVVRPSWACRCYSLAAAISRSRSKRRAPSRGDNLWGMMFAAFGAAVSRRQRVSACSRSA